MKYGKPFLLNLSLWHQGKSRDTFTIPGHDDKLLVVATDRISTHNIVHESTIPHKGEVLTALTIFWLIFVLGKKGVPHHLLVYGKDIYSYLPGNREDYPADLHRRAIIVMKLDMILVEFVFRNYLTGSLYREYYSKGIPNPYGYELRDNLPLMHEFPQTLFTPTDKSDVDAPLDAEAVRRTYAAESASMEFVFDIIRRRLNQSGIELVDTKGEGGYDGTGTFRIADEVGTPDCSRLCELSRVGEGVEPPWLDKQIARDEAERVWQGGKKYALLFNDVTVKLVSDTYLRLFERVVGKSLAAFQQEYLD